MPLNKHLFNLKVHDRFQVELKLSYPLSPARKREDFRVEAYLFVPSSLDIHPSTYTKAHFYQDLRTYTRYGTPTISLERLLDGSNELSPLTRLARMKDALATGRADPSVAEQAVYELRILACVFRSQVREQGDQVAELLARAEASPKEYQDALFLAGKLNENALLVIHRAREMRREFLGSYLPPALAEGFQFVDEGLSVQFEDVCGKLYRSFERALDRTRGGARNLPEAELAAMARRIAQAMRAEAEHRTQAGFATVVNPGEGAAAGRANEYLLYRVGMLKKYAQNVLFLSVDSHQGSRPVLYSLNALAAMLAMMAYLIPVLIFLPNPQANSLSAVALFLIAYAFKDRIKDGLKQFFSERMTGFLRDREVKLIDRGPDNLVVGRLAEAFSFVKRKRLPEQVVALRSRDPLTELAEEGSPETTMKYEKAITLYADRVFRVHKRVDSLDEILRLSVRGLLHRMDEPKKSLACLAEPEPAEPSENGALDGGPHPRSAPESAAGGAGKPAAAPRESTAVLQAPAPAAPGPLPLLLRVRASKVYHVNLVLRVLTKDPGGRWQADLEKFRLVLSRDGIERVETNHNGEVAGAHPVPAY